MELTAKNIEVSIGNKKIIEDVSLKVTTGEFVGILGANGSGKSTLLKSIYKIIKAKNGTVLLDNENIWEMNQKEVAKKLAVLGQFNDNVFDITVYDMVMLARTPYKTMMERNNKNDEIIVDEALKKVSMTDYKDRKFKSLSGGEQQRVILARCIAQTPTLLILDEPTNHLDIKYQLQCMKIVKSLEVGVLSALHDLTIASMYCTYIYMLKNGKIVKEGKPQDVITPENVKEVYDVSCVIEKSPYHNGLNITYLD